MEAERASLLKKVYYENCPGCKVDQDKEKQSGLPIRRLISIWIVVLCTALPISSLFPFLYFMIRDFHIAEKEEDIGYYAGYVGSSFMLGRALTSVFWGVVADRYGRKPVILIGTTSVVIFNTLFGLSLNFWMAIIMRFLLGSLNGLLGPIKAYAGEIFCAKYQSLGLSTVSTAWGIGLIIGPAVGGFLAQPADKYPTIFSQDSFLGRFPYFLPCFAISFFAFCVTIATFWLPETLHTHHPDKNSCNDSYSALEDESYVIDKEETTYEISKDNSTISLFKNWALMSSVCVYCIFSLHDMAYTEIFSLWAVSSTKYGGLSYTTDKVGEVLAVSGKETLIHTIHYTLLGKETLENIMKGFFLMLGVYKVFCLIWLVRIYRFTVALMRLPFFYRYPFYVNGYILPRVFNKKVSPLQNSI